MSLTLNIRRRWFSITTHSRDGWHIWTKPDLIVRLSVITFAYGKYKQTNKECYELDRFLNR